LFLTGEEIIDGNVLEKNLFYKYPYLGADKNVYYVTDENGN